MLITDRARWTAEQLYKHRLVPGLVGLIKDGSVLRNAVIKLCGVSSMGSRSSAREQWTADENSGRSCTWGRIFISGPLFSLLCAQCLQPKLKADAKCPSLRWCRHVWRKCEAVSNRHIKHTWRTAGNAGLPSANDVVALWHRFLKPRTFKITVNLAKTHQVTRNSAEHEPNLVKLPYCPHAAKWRKTQQSNLSAPPTVASDGLSAVD